MRKFILSSLIVASTFFSAQFVGASPRYSQFDNENINDCTYVAGANLVQHEYPGIVLTDKDVVGMWRFEGSPTTGTGGISFMEVVGFGGHTANFTLLRNPSRSTLIDDARHGGIYALVTIETPDDHALAVVGADNKGIQAVWYGKAINFSWTGWKSFGPISYYSVTWNPPAES